MKTARLLLASLLLTASVADAFPHRRSGQRAAQQHPPQQQTAPATTTTTTTTPDASATTLTAEQVMTQIQGFYDRTTSFEADFIQVSRNRLSGEDQRRDGHVKFRKPGMMRWDYNSPAGDVIVSDGSTLWAYEASAHQAIRSNLTESQLPSALSFLTGTGNLTHDFTFRMLDAARYRYPNGFVVELRPIAPNPSFERILFYVDSASYQVTRTVIFDAQGNQNRFDFLRPQVNNNHPDTLFQWTPPSGTQIVRP